MPKFNPFPDVSSKYGAPMGRASDSPGNFVDAPKLYVRKARCVDYDYDQGGAYWGTPTDLYAVWTRGGESVCYVRAASRADAVAQARGQA